MHRRVYPTIATEREAAAFHMEPTEFIAVLRKRKAGPAYFLRGPDRFLHEECHGALIASVPAEARAWCLAEIGFPAGGLERELEGAHQMPMLGGHNFLFFSDPEDFKHATDEDYKALLAYLERPSLCATVVFAAIEPDRRRRFIQLLEKKAQVVEIRPLARREAAVWARDFLRQAGVEIDPELAEQIAAKFETSNDREPERAGVNLLWMRTELEKLRTAKPGTKRLERQDLDLIVAFREEHQIGKFLRAIAERDCHKALEHLRALLASKVAETLLVWCVADLFRQTLRSAAGAASGRQAWYGPPNPFSTPAIVPVALGNYSREELPRALRLVRRADLGIKSSWKDSRILLEYLVWQIIVDKGEEAAPPLSEETLSPVAER